MSEQTYSLLRVLSETSEEHAKTIKRLGTLLKRLSKDIANDNLQLKVMSYIKRLRLLRSRIRRALDANPDINSVDNVSRENIATLSEYMILVGFTLERDMLNTALRLARKGARILEAHLNDITKDVDEVNDLSNRLERLISNFRDFR